MPLRYPGQRPAVLLLKPFIGLIALLLPHVLLAGDSPAVADVRFDHQRGLYSEPFVLALTTATKDATIRYTIDGSAPTVTAGTVYAKPIAIDGTTVVRAIATTVGSSSLAVESQSYVFPSKVLHQPEKIAGYPNPNEAINFPGAHEVDVPLMYGMNPHIIDDPQYAQSALEGLSQIPTVSIGVDPNAIFGANGFYDTPKGSDANKVHISFEFIDPKAPQANVGINAGISGHSRQKLKRSFHLHFGKKYGGPSRLDAPIFGSAPFGGGSATTEFTDLILRGGNNRSWATTDSPTKTTYTEDEFVRDMQIAMTGQGVHGTFVHLYINGIYWGLYNLVERPDDGYGQVYYKSKKGDYFSVNQNGTASGDDARWKYLMNTLCQQDMSIDASYAEMQKYVNVKQFADYLIGQWFCGVSDWPDNNYWAGGDTVASQPFQFYSWDGEFMINKVDGFATIPHGPWVNPAFGRNPTPSKSPVVKLWMALKANPEFMKMFTGEVDKSLSRNGPLSDAKVLSRWNALNNSINNAIVDESARWGDALAPLGRPTYTKNDDWIKATRAIAKDLKGADVKFIAALRAEGYYP